jgi:hypothetical protein
MVLSTNAAAAHEVTKVQPETRIRSSMRWTPSLLSVPRRTSDHMISDVVFERFRGDHVFAVTPVGKR